MLAPGRVARAAWGTRRAGPAAAGRRVPRQNHGQARRRGRAAGAPGGHAAGDGLAQRPPQPVPRAGTDRDAHGAAALDDGARNILRLRRSDGVRHEGDPRPPRSERRGDRAPHGDRRHIAEIALRHAAAGRRNRPGNLGHRLQTGLRHGFGGLRHGHRGLLRLGGGGAAGALQLPFTALYAPARNATRCSCSDTNATKPREGSRNANRHANPYNRRHA